MTTADLIQVLVSEARPVRRLQRASRRYFAWVSLTIVLVAAGAMAWGLRPDLLEKALEAPYLLESGLLMLSFGFAARSAFQLSVPGEERRVSTLALPLTAFMLWFSVILLRHWGSDGSAFAFDLKPRLLCILRILGLGTLPVIVSFVLLRRAAPQKRGWTGFFMSLSAFSVAALATQTLCTIDRPEHVLLWHALPVFIVGLLGAAVGKLAFENR